MTVGARVRVVILAVAATVAAVGCGGGPSEESADANLPHQDAAPGAQAVIHLCDGRDCAAITSDERQELEAALTADDDVLDVRFESREEAYEVFLELFADAPELAEQVSPELLVEAFWLVVRDGVSQEDLQSRYGEWPGVQRVLWASSLPAELRSLPDAVDRHPSRTSPTVAVFLCDGHACPEATPEQVEAVNASLDGDADVLTVRFESKQEAYERYLDRYADEPDLLDLVEPGDLPASFRVRVRDGVSVEEFAARHGVLPGVESVVADPDDVPLP